MKNYITTCTARTLCRKWKTCARCGAIRQARFADRAEQAAKQMQLPCFYVLLPDDITPGGIDYAKRWFQRNTKPQAGVWSIENSKFQAGFHLNVIADYAELPKSFKGRVYCEPIRTTIRAVAAYITKRERAASKEDGFARGTGDFGHVGQHLRNTSRIAPIVAGAQLQHELEPFYKPAPRAEGETFHEAAIRELRAIFGEPKNNKHNK